MSSIQLVLESKDIYKSYIQGGVELKILNGINLCVAPGDTISIMGSSGSGKSTLLHILAGLDKSHTGEVILDGAHLNRLSDNQICAIRNQKLGFIYQFHHLLPEFSALENVLMPLMIRGVLGKEDKERGRALLARLSLDKRLTHYPSQLSGGERQRVAIARAVINNPKLIFADEPTGNLDNGTSRQVLEIFFQVQRELSTSLVLVTHDKEVSAMTSKQYALHNGVLSEGRI